MTQKPTATTHTDRSRPLTVFAVGIVFMAVVLAIVGWSTWSTHRSMTCLVTDELRLQELRGTILHLDEVLTMSARMAAATGDLGWEERYHQFEPLLDTAIKEAIALVREVYHGDAAAQTDQANLKLVEMENRAFALVAQDKRDDAAQLLFSAEYKKQKEVYAEGMQKLQVALGERVQDGIRDYDGRALRAGILVLVAAVILLCAWITVFIALRTHLKKRLLAEEALENAHRELELRVEERTHDLGERVKELTCMYGVAKSIRERASLEEVFQDVAGFIPPGWHYPEITRGCVRFKGKRFVSEPFDETEWGQSSDILVFGEPRGSVDVYYLEERPDLDEGPFMKEERSLVDGIAGALSEFIERRQAEEELQEAHSGTKQLLEAISSLLIGVDHNGTVTAWNGKAERAFGLESKNAVGRPFHDLEIESDRAAIVRAISECEASNRSVRMDEMRYKRPDGTEGFLGMTVNPLHDGTGEPRGVLIVALDITEQKFLQSQLTQAQKLESIGRLAAGIAHEINTPIQYIGDNTRFLQGSVQDLLKVVERYRDLLSPSRGSLSWQEGSAEIKAALDELDLEFLNAEIPRAIDQSLEGVERVATIVRSMKDFSHPGEDEKRAADLNRAIESTITVARNEWKYVAEMVTEFDSSLPPVPCLLGDFNQVILNMIINAAHAISEVVGKNTGRQGTITISTRHNGEWAEIRVSDTGAGIPQEIQSKIFDPFFTTKDVGKGTGQGLAIARATVVNKHGGELSVDSEVGSGTTFIIRLPIVAKPDENAGAECHEEACSLP